MTEKKQDSHLSVSEVATNDASSLPGPAEVLETSLQAVTPFERMPWASGIVLSPTEYARVFAFEATIRNADRARIAFSESQNSTAAARRANKPGKGRPYCLTDEQVKRMEDMGLDLYGELRGEPRLREAPLKALRTLQEEQQRRNQAQRKIEKRELEDLLNLWDK